MKRLSGRKLRYSPEAAVNPMDGLGNLADAMLVLAVGIMLALLLHWKVDITAITSETVPENQNEQIAIDESDMSETEENALNEEEMQKIGALYFDEETGKYYAVVEE